MLWTDVVRTVLSREVNTWEVQLQSSVKGKRIIRENVRKEEGDVGFS